MCLVNPVSGRNLRSGGAFPNADFFEGFYVLAEHSLFFLQNLSSSLFFCGNIFFNVPRGRRLHGDSRVDRGRKSLCPCSMDDIAPRGMTPQNVPHLSFKHPMSVKRVEHSKPFVIPFSAPSHGMSWYCLLYMGQERMKQSPEWVGQQGPGLASNSGGWEVWRVGVGV